MNVILNFIKGIGIGAGAIIPGVSSGVLCVIFGIYEKLIDSILGFFHDWKKNLIYLFPIGFGGVIGIILFSNLLEYFFIRFPIPTQYCFIGLILGCVPVLFKTANSGRGFRLHYLIYLLFSLSFTLLLIYLEIFLSSSSINSCSISYNVLFLVFAGFCMSIGVIIPGVSSTVILMLLGVYELYLSSVAMVNMNVLLPMGLGLVIGSILFMKIIQILLKKYPSQTYYSIIGFVLGSIPILFPGFSFDSIYYISFVCMFVCFFIAYVLEKK